jgi:hypothetical protein
LYLLGSNISFFISEGFWEESVEEDIWPEGKRPLGRPSHRWEDNIKMDLREKGIDWANWMVTRGSFPGGKVAEA